MVSDGMKSKPAFNYVANLPGKSETSLPKHASIVEWYNSCLPSSRPGFDSRWMHVPVAHWQSAWLKPKK